MSESLLEASLRERRQVNLLYYWQGKVVGAVGHFKEVQPGHITFTALGGFEFTIPIGDVFRIDGRNPFMLDKPPQPKSTPTYTPAAPGEWVVTYVAGTTKNPNQHLFVQGTVKEMPGSLIVETSDGREFTIPRTQVVKIEYPGRQFTTYKAPGSNWRYRV